MRAEPEVCPAGLGVGVDAHGGPVVDPTKNVIALNEAASKRQDDLREAQNRLMDAKIAHTDEMGRLRAEHEKELSALESNRLNAIRQVDVLAVNTAADRAAAAIQALAVTTASNAENLRNALNITASTIAAQTAATVAAITERLGALEKSSYEGKGKSAFSDPMMAEVVAEMRGLRESRSLGTGKLEGVGTSWQVLVGLVALVATVFSIFAYISGRQPLQPALAQQPQVIYQLPAPAPPAK